MIRNIPLLGPQEAPAADKFPDLASFQAAGGAAAYGDGPVWIGGNLMFSGLITKSIAHLNGVNGKIKLPKTYTLQSDGDYVEFVVKADEKPFGSNVNLLGLVGLDNGTNSDWIGFAQAGTQFAIREAGQSIKTVTGLTDNWFYQFCRVRVTQTSSSVWTISINNTNVGTIARAANISVNCVGNGYLTEFVKCSIAELIISTAITGNFRMKNPSQDVKDFGLENSGVTYSVIKYDDDTPIVINYPVAESSTRQHTIEIYVKQKNSSKCMLYRMTKFVDASKNINCWRIANAAIANVIEWPLVFEKSSLFPRLITSGGMWDQVVRFNGPSDYTGGDHGGQVGTELIISSDADYTPYNFGVLAYPFFEFKLNSDFYKEIAGNYSAELAAKTVASWTFDSVGIKSKIQLQYTSPNIVDFVYLGMLPILRSDAGGNITGFASWDGLTSPQDVSTAGFTVVSHTSNYVEIYSFSSGLKVSLKQTDGIFSPHRRMWVTNASSPNYNKIYINEIGGESGLAQNVSPGQSIHGSFTYNFDLID